MMSLKAYLSTKKYADLYFDSINMCASVDSGLPIFLIAPPSGGKTTIIKFLEEFYQETTNYFVYPLERVSPLRFIRLQDQMLDRDNLFVSEDFSTMSEDEGAVKKMAIMIAKIAYDKRYYDPLFADKKHPDGLVIRVKSLGFVCGMQPLWMQIYAGKEVFETLIMEKIIRYYRLPIMPIHSVARMRRVVNWLKYRINKRYNYYPLREDVAKLAECLKPQCGARAKEYAYPLAVNLAHYIPKRVLTEWLDQLGKRFLFESRFLMRAFGIGSDMPTVEALHREYTVLFFALQYNSCTYKNLRNYTKVRQRTKASTTRAMRYLINRALEAGYVNVLRKSILYILPSKRMREFSVYDFDKVVTETEKHKSIDSYFERGKQK